MKCWNTVFNAQGSRVITVVVHVVEVKICVAAVKTLRKEKEETPFIAKFGRKTSLGPIYFVLWNFIPNYAFDAVLCRNWPFSPPNRQTLWITLMSINDNVSYERSSLEKPKKKNLMEKTHLITT
jgi:hypothetical protein